MRSLFSLTLLNPFHPCFTYHSLEGLDTMKAKEFRAQHPLRFTDTRTVLSPNRYDPKAPRKLTLRQNGRHEASDHSANFKAMQTKKGKLLTFITAIL